VRGYRVGVDIGGTFTDIVVWGEHGVLLWKQDTTPESPDRGVQAGLANVAAELELDLRSFLERVSLLVHGSTVATNMVIQRSGARVGLVCTEGFRDSLYFRDGFKWDRFNPRLPRPDDLVSRRLRLGVRERIDRAGDVVVPLEETSVRAVAAQLRAEEVEAVAVCLLWAHANPAHEQRVRELLAEELPEMPVLLSSDILPELGEWVRTSATVLSSFVYGGSRDYLRRLQAWLAEQGLAVPVLIMQVNGGCTSVDQALRLPVAMIHSGPAAAPAAALQVGRRADARDLITIDMGGTSFDVCLIDGGEVPRGRALEVEHQPIGVPGVEIHSIGAGGGSLAWIDAGGALRVGPRSAGARPGPAAYGRGGTLPTVTDANVVLGYLSPEAFLGGRRALRRDLAAEAIRVHVADSLGLHVEEAAAGMIRIVNQNMVDAIGIVSIERGIDPRPFLLIAGGGAGALHAAALATELGMGRVLVPTEAGTLSAYGMTVTDVRHDYAGALHTDSSAPALGAIAELYARLELQAGTELGQAGFSDGAVRLRRTVDARYVGQVHELLVAVPDGPLDEDAIARVEEGFHRLHDQRYGWSAPRRPVEFLHWRLAAAGLIEVAAEQAFDGQAAVAAAPARRGSRRAWFDEAGGFVEAPVYAGEAIPAHGELEGPAVVDVATTTIVVPPSWRLRSDGRGSFLMNRM
jgi:N-methylhydantoinase A